MKIKTDFITNSSSTAYIVLIPAELELTGASEEISELMKKSDYEWEHHFNENEEDAVYAINQNLQLLKDGHTMWIDDAQGFWTTQQYLHEKGLTLKSVDMSGGGGMDVVEPIKLEDIYKVLNKVEGNEN